MDSENTKKIPISNDLIQWIILLSASAIIVMVTFILTAKVCPSEYEQFINESNENEIRITKEYDCMPFIDFLKFRKTLNDNMYNKMKNKKEKAYNFTSGFDSSWPSSIGTSSNNGSVSSSNS